MILFSEHIFSMMRHVAPSWYIAKYFQRLKMIAHAIEWVFKYNGG